MDTVHLGADQRPRFDTLVLLDSRWTMNKIVSVSS